MSHLVPLAPLLLHPVCVRPPARARAYQASSRGLSLSFSLSFSLSLSRSHPPCSLPPSCARTRLPSLSSTQSHARRHTRTEYASAYGTRNLLQRQGRARLALDLFHSLRKSRRMDIVDSQHHVSYCYVPTARTCTSHFIWELALLWRSGLARFCVSAHSGACRRALSHTHRRTDAQTHTQAHHSPTHHSAAAVQSNLK